MDLQPRLEVIVGTMFSGKSSLLVHRFRRYKVPGYETVLFKPVMDQRYSETHVATHDGVQEPSIAVQNAKELAPFVTPTTKVIGIDEVQFFDGAIISLCNYYANEGKIVLAAGLLKDFRDQYFPFSDGQKNMGDLLAVADEVVYLSALCTQPLSDIEKCGQLATRVQRLVDGEVAPFDAPVVQVGGKEAYAPRCRKHYVAYQ